MTLPTRMIQAVRPQASSGVMASASVVAAIFAATPFLLPDVSVRLSVPLGTTGLLSTAQVGSFALVTFLVGRLLRPRRRLHYGALGLIVISSFASAAAPNFSVLLATRVVAGAGMGVLTWIAWADATRFSRGLGEVAAVAPLTAMIASPPLGWLIEHGGFQWVFIALGVLATAAIFLPVDFGDLPRIGRQVSGSKTNRMLLAALTLLTVGGSAVFIFTAATASALYGLSPLAISFGLSLNALTGVAATRFVAGKRRAGLWMAGTASAALVVGFQTSPWVFFLAVGWWGFAFWMAIPAVFRLLAERSLQPSERIGDAQALMAVGRVFGPIIGGVTVGAGQFGRLSLVGGAVMGVAALTVATAEGLRTRT